MFSLSEITFGNVSLNEALDEFQNDGFGYAVIAPCGFDENSKLQYSGEPFSRRDKAFERAMKISSKEGCWAYVLDTFDHHVIAYLTAYCANP